MAQAVYPAMVARGRGCIINIASQRGLKGAVNSAPYSAAKAGDHRLHPRPVLGGGAERRAGQRHRPGPDRHRPDCDDGPAEDRQAFIDALPVGRFGRPEEIAATALLLAGPAGRVLCRCDACRPTAAT